MKQLTPEEQVKVLQKEKRFLHIENQQLKVSLDKELRIRRKLEAQFHALLQKQAARRY